MTGSCLKHFRCRCNKMCLNLQQLFCKPEMFSILWWYKNAPARRKSKNSRHFFDLFLQIHLQCYSETLLIAYHKKWATLKLWSKAKTVISIWVPKENSMRMTKWLKDYLASSDISCRQKSRFPLKSFQLNLKPIIGAVSDFFFPSEIDPMK